jgi:hypothetical protein
VRLRLKEYRAEEEAGAISLRRLKTVNDIRRTSEGICPIATGNTKEVGMVGVVHHDPVGILAGRETTKETIDALKAASRRASPRSRRPS